MLTLISNGLLRVWTPLNSRWARETVESFGRHMATRATLIGLISIQLVLTSCAGITTSQVTWPRASDEQRRSFDGAMQYADVAKAKYRRAIGNQSRLMRYLGATLIPFGAAAGGIGATGGSAAAVVALLTATGGGIAEGAWLTSKPEQRAWAAGHNAITCAQSAVEPLRLITAAPGAENVMLDGLVRDVRVALRELDGAVVPARQGLAATRSIADATITTAAEQSLANAEATRQAANEALTNAERVRQEAARIPSQLIDTVDNIGGQIAVALTDQGPDVQALARLISGLAQGYGQFVQVPTKATGIKEAVPTGQAGVEDERLRGLTEAFRNLELKRLGLDRASRTLADRVNAIAATKPLDRLQACGVNTEKLAAPFTIVPAGPLQITAGKPITAGFAIQGGSPPFAVNLEGTNTDGLTVQHRDPMRPSFIVQVTDKTTQNTSAVVQVSDRSGRDQFLEISVAAPAAGGAGAGSGQEDIAKKLAQAAGKLVTAPAQSKSFGTNTAKIVQATYDRSNNKLNVKVEIDDPSDHAVNKAAAEATVNSAKEQILEWIAELLRDKGLKNSIIVQASNQ